MRSRGARLTVAALAWLTIPAAAFFLIQSDKQIADERAAERAFDLHAREATDALADLRARLRNDCQPRFEEVGPFEVVETDERDIRRRL